jgi:organic radical activating enzyme
MKAGNLTISVPHEGCDKDCPYCISKITGYIQSDFGLMKKNLPKVKTVAAASAVSSVLLTGKGEPMLNWDDTLFLIKKFSEYPVELQTNGLSLTKNLTALSNLYLAGLNTVALSVDSFRYLKELKEVMVESKRLGMMVRLCLNLTDRIPAVYNKFSHILEVLKKYEFDQLLIRHISYPEELEESDNLAIDWIKRHTQYKRYLELMDTAYNITGATLVRTLPHGAQVWDIGGLSVSFSDYCVQTVNNTEDIRSLIFLEDGHLYTSWASRASILF